MPTYQYRCKECGADLEVAQKFTDDALTTCPSCGAEALRKVYNAVGVHFKGSGFYRTDSRAKDAKSSGAGAASGKDGGAKADAAGSGSGSTGSGSTGSASSSTSSSTGTSGGGTAAK